MPTSQPQSSAFPTQKKCWIACAEPASQKPPGLHTHSESPASIEEESKKGQCGDSRPRLSAGKARCVLPAGTAPKSAGRLSRVPQQLAQRPNIIRAGIPDHKVPKTILGPTLNIERNLIHWTSRQTRHFS